MEKQGGKEINMRKSFCIAFIVSAALFILSCSKVGGGTAEEELIAIDNNDSVFPVINVLKPDVNQVYKSGDSIIVEGNVTDDKKMYKGKVQIRNDANGFVMAENYYETHFLQTISYRLAYKAVVSSPTDFSVLIEFQDHGANISSVTIKVKAIP